MRRLCWIVLAVVGAMVTSLITTVAPASAVQIAQDSIVRKAPASFTPHLLDGEVDALAQVGQMIVVGGTFTQAQNAGGGATLTRNYIMAFNKDTGAISTSFVPQLDRQVKALAAGPNGTVYVGGQFNNANGSGAQKLVQLRVSDGSRVAAFQSKAINAIIRDVRFTDGRLFVGGEFTKIQNQTRLRLAELDPTTGTLLPSLDIPVEGTHFGGQSQIYHMDVSPDGDQLALIGNFTTVGGEDRVEAAMIDLSTNPATLANWHTDRYEPRCYDVFHMIVRDVEFSPDGEYFAIGTTGGYGTGSPTLCDTVTRWESDATGSDLDPTWIDYSGGDSTYSVVPTGSAIYTGGHQRWWNNPAAADAEGPGAVARQGIAALDPENGLPLEWNPGRERGQGVFDMLATDEGLFIGSDTDHVNGGQYHGKLAFFPLAGGTAVSSPEPPDLPVDVYSLSAATPGNSPVLYRVNAAGPEILAFDSGPDWAGDTDATNPLRNGGNNSAGYSQVGSVTANVPTSTPTAVFSTERWDPDGAPDMQWDFPASAGEHLEVRLYFANQYDGTASPGQRVFDVSVDGNNVLDNYDITADVGHKVGTMKAFDITSDGNVDIDFGHVTENPLINAIEIVDLDAPNPGPSNEAVRHSYDGSTVGSAQTLPDAGIEWSKARGAVLLDGQLYTGWADGHLYRRSFNGTTFGAPQDVDLHGLSQFSDEMQRMTGMFYDNGRLYYTLSGSSTLYMRYFSTGADVVGAGLKDLQPFEVSDNVSGVDWSRVRGMFLADEKLYWVDRTNGDLHRIDWAGGGPGDGAPVAGTGTVVSGPGTDGVDWRYRAMFARQTAANQPPTANIAPVTCTQLSCHFDGSGSTDDSGIDTYAWDFGHVGGTSTETSPDHEFPSAGTYQVTLTVTDDDGVQDSATRQVQVSDSSAISFVAANGGSNQNQSVKNHNLTVPAGIQAGDRLVLAFSDNAPANAITPPAGWTQLVTRTTSGMTARVWTRAATGGMGGTNLRVTTAANVRGDMVLLAYRGADTVDPVATSAGETVNRANHTTPTATAPAGAWVVSYWSDKTANTASWATPGGQTFRHQYAGTGAGHMSHLVTDSGPVSAGTVGGVTATASSSSAQAVMATIVLNAG